MNYDENDEEPITTPDTTNCTKINPEEAPDPIHEMNGERKWDRLSGINTGAVDSFGNRKESVTRKQERASAFDIVSDHLELPHVYKREGREIMMCDIDTQTLSRPGSTVHLIAFCVAIHLVNRDNIPRSYHPERKQENNDNLFSNVADEFNFDLGMVNSILQKIEGQL